MSDPIIAAPTKWCTYCGKSDHDDRECWCTRSLPYAPRYPHPMADPVGDVIRLVAERYTNYAPTPWGVIS